MESLLKPVGVAKVLDCSPATVYRLVREQGLPAVRVGADLRFRLSDVESWLEARSSKVAAS